jgi:hypothetical protein
METVNKVASNPARRECILLTRDRKQSGSPFAKACLEILRVLVTQSQAKESLRSGGPPSQSASTNCPMITHFETMRPVAGGRKN